jgi:hypothetical protein
MPRLLLPRCADLLEVCVGVGCRVARLSYSSSASRRQLLLFAFARVLCVCVRVCLWCARPAWRVCFNLQSFLCCVSRVFACAQSAQIAACSPFSPHNRGVQTAKFAAVGLASRTCYPRRGVPRTVSGRSLHSRTCYPRRGVPRTVSGRSLHWLRSRGPQPRGWGREALAR